MKEDIAIQITDLKKKYKLGAIGGGTLSGDIKSWWALKRGKEDPNSIVGTDTSQYGQEFYALNGINLEIKKGEAIGIIGTNGAGKSTLLKILSRVTAPSDGEVHIRGRITSMLEVGTGFHGELTGRENIYMNGAILGMTKKEVDEKIEEIIDFSECRKFIDTPVKRYSSGMYVKLAFAVASHLDSEIMIMDEVLAVGDMAFQKKCLNKMSKEAHAGKTVLYVSHNMATIQSLCTRCIVLDKGTIIYDGDVDHAIDLYMGSNNKDIDNSYIDNRLKDRTTSTEPLGEYVMMTDIVFKNKEKLVYRNNEDVVIDVSLEPYEDLTDLYIGIIIAGVDLIPIGFEYIPLSSLSRGDNKHLILKTNFSELPEGDYNLQINLHRQNRFGVWDTSLDKTDWIKIRLQNCTKRLQWKKEWFGPVEFHNLEEIH